MRGLVIGAVALAATGCIVMRPPTAEQRPVWRIASADDHYAAGCVAARAFVRKSGKQGLGIAIQLRSRGDCTVAIAGARFALGSRELAVPGLAPLAMHGHSQAYAWLPVHFDNNTAWNDGDVAGRLVLAITLDGTPAPAWTLDLRDEMNAPVTP